MIRVEEIHASLGGHAVLRGASLAVAPGDIAVLVGPSGAGKTTLLRCIAGFESFRAGTIRVADVTIPPDIDARRDASLLRALRRRVGLVAHDAELFPHLDVLDNLALAPTHVLGVRREDARADALAWLARFGLETLASRRVGSLSAGQAQRVALARAAALRPAALLLDEPTSALDPVAAREVVAIVRDLAADGVAFLIVTHAERLVAEAASQVLRLQDGVCVADG